jgi:hypothetical protein
MDKHQILQRTGATSDQFDRLAKKWFGSETPVTDVHEIWLLRFIAALTNKLN